MTLVERVQNIITKPAQEWPVIAAEPTTPAELYKGYVVPLAAIPPICLFLATLLYGHRTFFIAAVMAILSFALELVYVTLVAVIADNLAPSFGAPRNANQAVKLVGYAWTPRWIAGILNFIPGVGALAILIGTLYSLYLVYLGVTPLMSIPPDRSVVYTIVVLVAAMVVAIVVSVVISIVFATLVAGAVMSSGLLGH
jgi:hypothetical protein